jgi:hypothetical protein
MKDKELLIMRAYRKDTTSLSYAQKSNIFLSVPHQRSSVNLSNRSHLHPAQEFANNALLINQKRKKKVQQFCLF